MKKSIAILVSLLFINNSFAQEAERTSIFSLGPSVGFGHTGMRNMGGTDLFKEHWEAGLIMNYSKWEHFGLGADVLFSTEGGRASNEGRETDLTLQYIRVPIKFSYFFRDMDDAFRPKITVGPSMGFLTEARQDIEDQSTTTVTSACNSFDFGLHAGLGFNYKLGTNLWLNTDIGYYGGLTKVISNDYNRNLGLKVGLAFGL